MSHHSALCSLSSRFTRSASTQSGRLDSPRYRGFHVPISITCLFVHCSHAISDPRCITLIRNGVLYTLALIIHLPSINHRQTGVQDQNWGFNSRNDAQRSSSRQRIASCEPSESSIPRFSAHTQRSPGQRWRDRQYAGPTCTRHPQHATNDH